MIARGLRPRSGITLTEILISILIMGVGLISLATLFPLGLLRLREASRNSRSALAYETAADEMDTRALFYKPWFTNTWYWTSAGNLRIPRDPFVQDVDSTGNNTSGIIASNPNSTNGQFPSTTPPQPLLVSGLPFCYDPLWRSITNVVPSIGLQDQNNLNFTLAAPYVPDEARFGAGVFNGASYPYLRDDPSDPTNKVPSAYGLQRLTNFIPWSAGLTSQYPLRTNLVGLSPLDMTGNVFASIDDIVFNPTGGGGNAPSSMLPDMSAGGPQSDYRFTWFVTGRQVDAGGNGTQFVGEVVVCDGRPFGFDPLPGQAGINAPAGETVVEAIYGYGGNVIPFVPGGPVGFSSSTKSVLLRWPTTLPDPQVRVGGWICDTTYERYTNTFASRMSNTLSTFARCYWYQIGKRTDPQADTLIPNSPYRSMVLTLTSPVRARTLLYSGGANNGQPYHLNAALVMPSVITVFPRAFEVH